jgi:hypothetical protein
MVKSLHPELRYPGSDRSEQAQLGHPLVDAQASYAGKGGAEGARVHPGAGRNQNLPPTASKSKKSRRDTGTNNKAATSSAESPQQRSGGRRSRADEAKSKQLHVWAVLCVDFNIFSLPCARR